MSGAWSPCWVTRHFPCLCGDVILERSRPLQMAAGSNQAAGKLPVATAASLLDTVVVTRRRRRMASFAFPSGGAPTSASADSPPVMWCNPNDERCAHADNAGDSTPAAFLNERTAMVACRRGGGGRRPSATTSLSFGRKVGDGLQLQQCEGERNVQAPRLGLHWHRPSHAAEYGTSSRVGVVPVRADRRTGRYLGPYLALPGGG